MGQGKLLAAGSALILGAALAAQSPLYRERWADLHLELLRERVLRESDGRDAATLAEVAALLLGDDQGVPFRPAAKALARLRSVPCDDAFLLRATVGAFVLPEVVDPQVAADAPAAECRSLQLSLFLPFQVPLPGKVSFAVEVVDAAGARLCAATIERDTALDDLRMARARFSLPGEALADGRYRVRVQTLVDGQPPRATDPRLEHAFAVLRGYQVRADAARARCQPLLGKLGETASAVLAGFLQEVDRAYGGVAFDGQSDAVADLERLERALTNHEQQLAPWSGMTGDTPLGLPTGGSQPMQAVVRLPKDKELRPLLVFVGAPPAYDTTGRRPTEPAWRSARWVHRRLGDFGLGAACHIAWLQSPGAGVRFQDALPRALLALRQILPADGRVVLVLENESAMLAALTGDLLMQETSGTVLVGAGAFTKDGLQKLGGLRLLGVPLDGLPGNLGLQRTAEVAAGKFGAVEWSGRFELAPARPRPWTFGAAAAAPEIAAFARDVFGLKPAK